jgi:two-component system sensor histidine kinase HydH
LPDLLSTSEPSSATSAIATMAPVVIVDAPHDHRANKDFTQRLHHHSVLAVPLIAAGQPIGAVILGETRQQRPFEEAEVERAMAISNQLAAAISSAKLYDDLKRSYHELSRTQEELVKRERLAAVGELAALVAHEVRNPLAVIFNALSSLKKLVAQTDQVGILFGILSEEANRLNGIVGDFLDFARPYEPDLQLGSLAELIEDCVEAARGTVDAPSAECRLELTHDLPPFSFDPRLLRQAFINLLVNGLQAMPKGGTLTVRSEQIEKAGKVWAQVEVSDTGTGVPLHLQKKLFQPFFTTKASGTGLGLAVVKRIVEAHNGEIEFESELKRGTTFRVRLLVH